MCYVIKCRLEFTLVGDIEWYKKLHCHAKWIDVFEINCMHGIST